MIRDVIVASMLSIAAVAGDSDSDGAADLAAWPAERSADGWYQGWAVEHLAERPGEVTACSFMDVHGQPETGCVANGRNLSAEAANAYRWAADPAAVLARIRAAGDACRLTPADMRRATT